MSKAKFPNTTRRRLSSVVIINSSNKNKVDNNIKNNDKTIRAIRIVMIAMIMIMITLVVIIMITLVSLLLVQLLFRSKSDIRSTSAGCCVDADMPCDDY